MARVAYDVPRDATQVDEANRQGPAAGRRPQAARGVLVLACAAQFMVVLDVSVVNVALPSIRTDLGFTTPGLPWVANAYALVFAGFLLLGGRLADLYGRRRIFAAGLSLFTAASVLGGVANTPGLLITARGVQGLGAAVLAPATLTILTTTFAEGPRRTRALAIWTAFGLAGGAAGNLVGGVLTEFLTWRSILLINVPIGAIALVAAPRHLPADPPAGRTVRLDVAGTVTAILGLAALTYGIGQAAPRGWTDPATGVPLAAGVAALTVFAIVETRFAAQPLLPPRLLRLRAVSVGNVLMLLAGACFQIPMWYFLTLYMQRVLHYTAVQTGLAFLPHTALTMAVSLRLTPPLMKHLSARTLVALGALIAATGFAWQTQITPHSGYLTAILGPAILMSVGGGLLNTPLTTTVTTGVPTGDAGAASGLMNTTKQVGGALGLAALVTLTTTRTSTPYALTTAYSHAFAITAVFLTPTAILTAALPAHRDKAPAERR